MTLKDYIISVIEHHWNRSPHRMPPIKDWCKSKNLIKLVRYQDKLVPESNTWTCPNCKRMVYESAYNTENLGIQMAKEIHTLVDGKRGFVDACVNCVGNLGFLCRMSSEYYMHDQFQAAVMSNGRVCCYEDNQDKIAKHPSGKWVDVTRNSEYHHGIRDWHRPNWASPGKLQERVFGIELEILASSKRGCAEYVRKAAVERGLAAERDGSLDGDYGIEIVGPPLSYAQATDPNGQWGQFLSDIQGKALGWDAGTGYGMHINMDTRTFSLLQLSKFMNFICHNEGLMVAVAGRTQSRFAKAADAKQLGGLRSSIYRHGMGVRSLLQHFGVLSDGEWNTQAKVRPGITDKYLACSIRSEERVEVRAFRSTIRWDRFKRSIQFADSMQRYVEQASNRTYLDAKLYCAWLSGQQVSYPELCSFMYQRKLFGTYMTTPPCKKVLEMSDLCNDESDTAKQKPLVRPGKAVKICN